MPSPFPAVVFRYDSAGCAGAKKLGLVQKNQQRTVLITRMKIENHTFEVPT